MNETVKEWLAKAEGDYQTASRELSAPESPNFDATCFHAQQCIEKIMKAMLIQDGVVPPRTHDLIQLDESLRERFPTWDCKPEDLRFLTRAAVAFRYPGEAADREDATEAFQICTRLRAQLLKLMPG